MFFTVQIKVNYRMRNVLVENKGLKHRRPDWKLVEGTPNYNSSLDPVKEAITAYMDNKS